MPFKIICPTRVTNKYVYGENNDTKVLAVSVQLFVINILFSQKRKMSYANLRFTGSKFIEIEIYARTGR